MSNQSINKYIKINVSDQEWLEINSGVARWADSVLQNGIDFFGDVTIEFQVNGDKKGVYNAKYGEVTYSKLIDEVAWMWPITNPYKNKIQSQVNMINKIYKNQKDNEKLAVYNLKSRIA